MQKVIALEDLLAKYSPETNISARFMTKFEKTSLLGVRIEQISQGSPTTLPNDIASELKTPQDLAEKELELKLIPYKLLRTMPSGRQELWNVEDLIILD